MANRVTDCIGRYEKRIEALHGVGLNGVPLEEAERKQALTFEEFFAYQNAQALAFAQGRLTFDEAQTVYIALGGEGFHGDWPKGTSLATKLTIVQLMGELMLAPKRRSVSYAR